MKLLSPGPLQGERACIRGLEYTFSMAINLGFQIKYVYSEPFMHTLSSCEDPFESNFNSV